MSRHAIVGVLGAALYLMAAHAEAQIYEFIKVCKRTVAMNIACIVIEKGAEIVVEKAVDEWLAYYRNNKGSKQPPLPPGTVQTPTPGQLEDFRRNGFEWARLMRELDRLVGTKPLTPKNMEAILKASCATRISFACRQLGVSEQTNSGFGKGCDAIKTQAECATNSACIWSGIKLQPHTSQGCLAQVSLRHFHVELLRCSGVFGVGCRARLRLL